jgi:hypothetical protein
VAILSHVISLVIILALVMVPLALIARLSFTVLARLLGVVSQSEVATRAEFDRIREQLLATAGDDEGSGKLTTRQADVTAPQVDAPARSRPTLRRQSRGTLQGRTPARSAAVVQPPAPEPAVAEWRECPTCMASVPSTASICLQCGVSLSAQS